MVGAIEAGLPGFTWVFPNAEQISLLAVPAALMVIGLVVELLQPYWSPTVNLYVKLPAAG